MKNVFENWSKDQINDENQDKIVATRKTISKPLEGPSIVFESRIAELEAQLTQSKLELRKVRDDKQSSIDRITALQLENVQKPQLELERAYNERRELETKLNELQRELTKSEDIVARNKRIAEQADYERSQAVAEVKRLRDELERRQEKLRETLEETNRRTADEKLLVERRYSQQVEQLSNDVANHWETANKTHLEMEKQKREIEDLRRELGQSRSYVEDLKKETSIKICEFFFPSSKKKKN